MRTFFALLLTVCTGLSATVTGTLKDSAGNALSTNLIFQPVSTPIGSSAIIYEGTPITNKSGSDGTFSQWLALGKYRFTISKYPSTWTIFTVPDDSNTYDLSTLLTNAVVLTGSQVLSATLVTNVVTAATNPIPGWITAQGTRNTNHANEVLKAATNYADAVIAGTGTFTTNTTYAFSGGMGVDGAFNAGSVSAGGTNLHSLIKSVTGEVTTSQLNIASNAVLVEAKAYADTNAVSGDIAAGTITVSNLTASRVLATDAQGIITNLPAGTAGQFVSSTGTGYAWADPPSGTGPSGYGPGITNAVGIPALALDAGANVTLTTNGNRIAIAATGGGSTLTIQTNSTLVGTLQNLRFTTNGVLVGTL